MSAQRTLGWGIIAAFVALLLWILGKHTTLASGVQTGANVFLTTPDPATGAPQFDSSRAETIPAGQGIPALTDPGSGALIVPPAGYTLWHDIAKGGYFYFPVAVSGVGVNASAIPTSAAGSSLPPYLV